MELGTKIAEHLNTLSERLLNLCYEGLYMKLDKHLLRIL